MAELRQRVENLAGKFPLYPNLSSDAIEVAWCPICFRSARTSCGGTWTRRSHKDRVVRFLLTCDSVGGLVQIPCIERNALANLKDINAARLALHGDGGHKVSLDKETSLSYRSKK